MRTKQVVAMLLAGGQGSRLGLLTRVTAKPAVPFGGRYRIIDFPLSNCANSGIDTVGVLTQYQPLELNSYIGSGASWDLDLTDGGVFVLPPYVQGSEGRWYSGTADAIYQNLAFIDQYSPRYVLILSGDHIYKMDYSAMLDYHIKQQADITIAVRPVPWEVAPSFGIGQLVLPLGQLRLHPHHIGIAFAPQLLLTADFGECAVGCGAGVSQHFGQLAVV